MQRDTVWDLLARPFGAQELNWRDAPGGKKLIYIDARAVIDRLNDALPGRWEDRYEVINVSQRVPVDAAGKELRSAREAVGFIDKLVSGMLCTITLRLKDENGDDYFISRSGCGQTTDIEDMKGAESDSLKRAAVKFGIGRYLYDLGEAGSVAQVPQWARPGGTGRMPGQLRTPAAYEPARAEDPPAPPAAPPPIAPPVTQPYQERLEEVVPPAHAALAAAAAAAAVAPPPAQQVPAAANDLSWARDVPVPEGLSPTILHDSIKSGPETTQVSMAGGQQQTIRVKGRPFGSAVLDISLRRWMHLASADHTLSPQGRAAWSKVVGYITAVREHGQKTGAIIDPAAP